MKYKISFVVAIYGVEKFLKKCIESILSQTKKDFEVILVDDGSEDSCPQICDGYALIDSRIKVIHKENGGLVSARKAGLAVAQGDYIINVDGDDWVSSDMLSRIVDELDNVEKTPEVICFDYYDVNIDEKIEHHQNFSKGFYDGESLVKLRETMLYDSKNKTHFNISPNLWCKVIKRDVLMNIQNAVLNEISFGEDVAVVYPLLCDVKSILLIDDCLYYYRKNLESMVNKYDTKLYEKTKKLYMYLEKTLNEQQRDNQLPYYACIMITNLLVNDMRIKSSFKEIFLQIKKYCEDDVLSYYIKKVKLKNLPLKHMLIHLLLKTKQVLILVLVLRVYTRMQIK